MKSTHFLWFALPALISFAACGNTSKPHSETRLSLTDKIQYTTMTINDTSMNDSIETATFGAGCFWCVEAIFLGVNGVTKVESGYSGGQIKNPSYKEVCNGTTGHAEVCQVTFDPRVVSFAQLLEVFFETHDPTTLNRQGADVGTQYRSAIFYHSDGQKQQSELAIKAANESGNWSDPIVTEVSAFDVFYKAEDYHQDYFALHGTQPYCQMVIRPKVDKFKKKFGDLMKEK
ncbi:MAG: peptide-methionine (S)-S-oxide reductase MsrA [Flavobacteriales bacterium]